ncbi:MAG: DUF167 domain-containing protein [Candidatus Thorarchaeota archaeon]|nr:DUF167 domain-containing protein [Candidatus Thorarchaeota archaeon]
MEKTAIWEKQSRIFIRVLVRPNSRSKRFIEEITDTHISINLRGPAREGKANTELVKRLAKIIGISTSHIMIVTGHKSREKILAIEGPSVQEIIETLRL